MSQGQYAPKKKSSPCCIGCIVIAGLCIVLFGVMGYYGYNFVKEKVNFALVEVTTVPDPALDTKAETLMPEQVGDFTRRTLNDNFSKATIYTEGTTSGVAFAEYVDSKDNYITVIAVPTETAKEVQKKGSGQSGFSGRFSNNNNQYGVSFKDFITSGGATTLTWQKPNWTFLVQTTSTLEQDFVKNFKPGSSDSTQESSTTPADAATTPSES